MFQFQCINHSDVVKIINDFDDNKAQGYDRMPMKLLQMSAAHISCPCHNVITAWWRHEMETISALLTICVRGIQRSPASDPLHDDN